MRIVFTEEEFADGTLGACTKCGETAYGVEPDAREYKCESCGARAVYGAEELLLMERASVSLEEE